MEQKYIDLFDICMERNTMYYDADKNINNKDMPRSRFTIRVLELMLNRFDDFTKLLGGVSLSYDIAKMLPDKYKAEANKYSKSREIPNKYVVDNDVRLFNKRLVYIEGLDYRDETKGYLNYFKECDGYMNEYGLERSIFMLTNEDCTDGVFGIY